MPISESEVYGENHFQKVYDEIIVPSCKKAGYNAIRADNSKESNMILFGILNDLLSSDIAICDISTYNPNVFYELGIRHARKLKTVLIKDENTKYPFDVSGVRCFDYNSSLSYESVLADQKTITEAIIETVNSKDPNSALEIFDGYQKYVMLLNPEMDIIKQVSAEMMLNASTGGTQNYI